MLVTATSWTLTSVNLIELCLPLLTSNTAILVVLFRSQTGRTKCFSSLARDHLLYNADPENNVFTYNPYQLNIASYILDLASLALCQSILIATKTDNLLKSVKVHTSQIAQRKNNAVVLTEKWSISQKILVTIDESESEYPIIILE